MDEVTVTVTGADRWAAAEYRQLCQDAHREGRSLPDLSTAFARHRIAALADAQVEPVAAQDVAALVEALEPFAALADEVEQVAAACETTPEHVAKVCQWEDLLAARAALAKVRP